ncbi:hypothetical protein [Robertkochia solimangrovi]|uniref:hypothetical protein n=1 Tax=Robertkochia solimangrovi TaxID=2213046 RepID=UPI001F55865A|nr:hypothetical protein [Robertkochia solimangrovi]
MLTVFTQIGGVLYLISILIFRDLPRRLLTFMVLYLMSVLIIVPQLAPIFGREPIKVNDDLVLRSIVYRMLNRNYVTEEMNNTLLNISDEFAQKYPGMKVVCLDANFPFFTGFPLLPHRSHNDGRKVDIAFIYMQPDRSPTNKKVSVSGYGIFEGPAENEKSMPSKCRAAGYWQYGITRYATFGTWNKELLFNENYTRGLCKIILKQPALQKMFIEPHLKSRMKLSDAKVRFHGCAAVRHDDHIHIQI